MRAAACVGPARLYASLVEVCQFLGVPFPALVTQEVNANGDTPGLNGSGNDESAPS